MPEVPILFATEYAVSRSRPLSDQTLENLFVERQPPEAKSQAPLIGAPGLDPFATTSSAPDRGSHNFLGVAYTVLLERKLLARIQNRWGPCRVGPFGKQAGTNSDHQTVQRQTNDCLFCAHMVHMFTSRARWERGSSSRSRACPRLRG